MTVIYTLSNHKICNSFGLQNTETKSFSEWIEDVGAPVEGLSHRKKIKTNLFNYVLIVKKEKYPFDMTF